MTYFLINENGNCGGTTGVKPEHDNWTETPYLGGLIKEQWNGTAWVESASEQDIQAFNTAFNNELDSTYTRLISELVDKHVQKHIIDGTPIPQDIVEERQRLKAEYKTLVKT